ncbi:hypothetical protein ASPCAL07119 [Aspergillus calidoustus]|uniref:Major facilitator superfamily (MFS) profile domain-containing protein n=1 Tax=Aspergillus calidoustus TaxID=454130 RepID=A0A0U5G475_ASPCI|nr:hypothetical protein ASPCAL07119 [Aspergillus calidoustus]
MDDNDLYSHTYRLAALISVGAFLVGYNTGVTSTIVGEPRWNDLMNPAGNWAATDSFSAYNLSAVIGSLCAGHLADRYGREMVLVLSGLVCAVGTLIQVSSFTLPQWIVGNIVLGWGVGACFTGIPIYLSEIAPATRRCQMMASEQLAYYAGFQAGFCPRWLVAKGRINQARGVLHRLHGADLAKRELKQIQVTFRAEKHLNLSWTALWKSPILKLMAMTCGVRTFQQITGTHSIISLTPSLFEKAGLCVADDCLFATIAIPAVIYHSTWIAEKWLDRFGRKTWLKVGTNVMMLSLSMTSVLQLKMEQDPDWYGRYMVLPFPFLFYIFHNLSWAIAGSTYASEIFSTSLRARGIALSTALGWALNYFVTVCPSLGDAIGGGLYLVYAMICLVAFVFVRFALVETKDMSLEEINRVLLPDYYSAAEGAGGEDIDLLSVHEHTE